jgi:hypothetical protein
MHACIQRAGAPCARPLLLGVHARRVRLAASHGYLPSWIIWHLQCQIVFLEPCALSN